jgi:alpha-tubulin suppressor-like RCC1 family protein
MKLRFLAASLLGAGALMAAASCGAGSATDPDEEFDPGARRDGGKADARGDTSTVDPPDASTTCTSVPCVRHLAVGGEFACAIVEPNGEVWCWGANDRGQSAVAAADGGIDPGPIRAPKKVPGLGPAKELALGFYHACALLMDETVSCWGHGLDGQLGNSAGPDVVAPRAVNGIPAPVKQIVAGGYHTCARLAGGGAVCWGYNSDGQLGSGSLDAGAVVPGSTSAPTTVTTLAAIAELGVGDRFTCARLQDGSVHCFGDNSNGKLGRGTNDFTGHPEPAPVTGLVGPVAYLARSGGYAEHVVLADGRVQGWGENTNGEVGLGAAGAAVLEATLVPNLTSISEIAPGGEFTCGLHTDGTVTCWGKNDQGQIGLAPEAGTPQPVPKAVPGISSAVHLGAGLRDFACALLSGGSVVCWGSNSDGQLGRGSTVGYDPTPAPVKF